MRQWMAPALVAALVLYLPLQAQAQGPPLLPGLLFSPPQLTSERSPGGAASLGAREGEEPIETDRDSFTPATTTVGKGRLVVESAYSFLDNRGIAETHSYPELVLRYGLTKRLELRLGWNLEVGGAGSDVSSASLLGGATEGPLPPELARREPRIETETTITYGIKFLVTEQDGWLPRSAVILAGRTPTSGMATDTHFVGTYVFGWTLPSRWQLDAAMRYATGSEEGDRFGIWAPSMVLKVPVGQRWNVHGEYFGLFSSNRESDFVRHYFSPGVHFLVTPDLEIGTRVGWGLNDQAARFFVNTGFGYRF